MVVRGGKWVGEKEGQEKVEKKSVCVCVFFFGVGGGRKARRGRRRVFVSGDVGEKERARARE